MHRSDCDDDRAGDRQRGRQRARCRVGRRQAACRGLRPARCEPARIELALGANARRLPRAARHRRDHGGRHAQAHAAPAGQGLAERRDRHRSAGGARTARARGAGHVGPRSREAGHAEGALRVHGGPRRVDGRERQEREEEREEAQGRRDRLRGEEEHPPVPRRYGQRGDGGARKARRRPTSSR